MIGGALSSGVICTILTTLYIVLANLNASVSARLSCKRRMLSLNPAGLITNWRAATYLVTKFITSVELFKLLFIFISFLLLQKLFPLLLFSHLL